MFDLDQEIDRLSNPESGAIIVDEYMLGAQFNRIETAFREEGARPSRDQMLKLIDFISGMKSGARSAGLSALSAGFGQMSQDDSEGLLLSVSSWLATAIDHDNQPKIQKSVVQIWDIMQACPQAASEGFLDHFLSYIRRNLNVSASFDNGGGVDAYSSLICQAVIKVKPELAEILYEDLLGRAEDGIRETSYRRNALTLMKMMTPAQNSRPFVPIEFVQRVQVIGLYDPKLHPDTHELEGKLMGSGALLRPKGCPGMPVSTRGHWPKPEA